MAEPELTWLDDGLRLAFVRQRHLDPVLATIGVLSTSSAAIALFGYSLFEAAMGRGLSSDSLSVLLQATMAAAAMAMAGVGIVVLAVHGLRLRASIRIQRGRLASVTPWRLHVVDLSEVRAFEQFDDHLRVELDDGRTLRLPAPAPCDATTRLLACLHEQHGAARHARELAVPGRGALAALQARAGATERRP